MAAKATSKPMRILKTSDDDFSSAWRNVCDRRADGRFTGPGKTNQYDVALHSSVSAPTEPEFNRAM